MSFTINFYKNTDERIKVNKSLSNPYPLTGELKEGCSITSPSILIEKTGSERETLFDYNYAFIEKFNRYYFIDDVISENTHLWRINMSVDVLKSYNDGIKNLTAMVARSEDSTIYDINQENKIMFTEYAKEITEVEETGYQSFNTSDTATQYVLTYFTISNDARSYDTTNPKLPDRPTTLFSKVNTSKLGNTSASHTSIIKNSTYLLDGNMSTLALCIAETSSLADFISSCIVFPFDLDYITDSSGSQVNYTLYLGKTAVVESVLGTGQIPVKAYEPYYQACPVINIADFTIQASGDGFLDYEPYTTYELYLPYKGWITLQADQVVGKRIRVDYTCELTSVTGLVQVYTREDDNSKLLYESECQLGVNVPFSVTDNQERTANIATSAVSSAVGMLSSVLLASII